MNIHALPYEFQTRQALAALRLLDAATGRIVSDGARPIAPSLRFFRKPNGVYAVTGAEGGPAHAITILPAAGAYLPRRFTLQLPRPRNPGDAESVFKPVDIELFPAPAYPLAGGAYPLRVTVRREADGARIGGALLRLRRAAGPALSALSITDETGEALIALSNLPPLITVGVDAREAIPAELDIMVDATQARFTADADVAGARGEPLILDPGTLQATATITTHAITLNAARPSPIALTWKPP
jgi:hypothetical protein